MVITSYKNKRLPVVLRHIYSARYYSKDVPEKDRRPEIPKNVLADVHTAYLQPKNGEIYDKKPFKVLLEKDKKYYWCLCGQGHNQPFCDNTHRWPMLKITLKPILFQVKETKEYWLCNCKQTKNRPFCDGSHKSELVQEACKYK